jgi:hypothetical protein
MKASNLTIYITAIGVVVGTTDAYLLSRRSQGMAVAKPGLAVRLNLGSPPPFNLSSRRQNQSQTSTGSPNTLHSIYAHQCVDAIQMGPGDYIATQCPT